MIRNHMTLVEVVIALAVLAIGFSSLLSLMSMATNRSAKAEARWDSAHRLSQAAEFFLLCGPKARIDDRFFPYAGANAECHVEKPEGLPEDVDLVKGDWTLAKLKITISQDGAAAKAIEIEKILKTQDCQ